MKAAIFSSICLIGAHSDGLRDGLRSDVRRGGLTRCTSQKRLPSVGQGDRRDLDGVVLPSKSITKVTSEEDLGPRGLRGHGAEFVAEAAATKRVQPTFRLPLKAQILPSKKKGGSPKKARYASINVGTPRREFKVLLDTGSAHLIIPGWNCQSKSCLSNTRFKSAASATAVDINVDGSPATRHNRDQMSVSFGRGEVTGSLVSDEICIPLDFAHTGPHNDMIFPGIYHRLEKATEFCVPLHFLSADEMSDEPFTRFEFDGVMGMSLKGLSQTDKFNFPNMLSSGNFVLGDGLGTSISASEYGVNSLFAMYLAKDDAKSQVHFGGWDSDLLTSPIEWAPVSRPQLGYWTTLIKNVRANGVELDLCKRSECYAVFDSGTSGLAAPGEAVSFLRENLDPHFQQAYDSVSGKCDMNKDIILEVEFESHKLVFGAHDLAHPRTEITEISEACQASIFQINMPPPLGPNIFILGEPVLQKYYTIFDVENERVGTATFQDKKVKEADNLFI